MTALRRYSCLGVVYRKASLFLCFSRAVSPQSSGRKLWRVFFFVVVLSSISGLEGTKAKRIRVHQLRARGFIAVSRALLRNIPKVYVAEGS